MKQLSLLTLVILLFQMVLLNAQVAINENNNAPDASAILDVQSINKGVLIPRMSSAERIAINPAAESLLVYDNTTQSFWYYKNTAWQELDTDTKLSEIEVDVMVGNNGYLTGEVDGSINNELQSLSLSGTDLIISDGNTLSLSSLQTILTDADNDTKIQVEEGEDDDDIIRFDMGGTEYFQLQSGRIIPINNGISVFLGQRAGNSDDQSNNENIYIGYYAGDQNVSSSANVCIGRAAGEKHTSGNFTVALGNYALQKHETGANNVALGAYAMNNSINGDGNTVLGTGALRFDTIGNNNVSIGSFSLYNGKDLGGNVAIGNNAGYNATGDNNVFLGKSAGYNATESNTLYIDNTNTASPLIYGEFDNNLLRVNGTLNATGEISGNSTMNIATTGVVGNIGVGSESTDQNTSNQTGNGFTTTPWLYTNAIEAQGERGSASTLITIGNDGTHGGDDQIHFVTSGNSQMQIASDGKIGIDQVPDTDIHIRQSQQSIDNGTGGIKFEDSSDATDYWRTYHSGIYFSFNLQGNRVAYVNTNGAWTVDSDLSLKKNINNLPSVLDRISSMRPVSYHYTEQADSDSKSLGFIAQEVQPLFPEMVVEGEDGKLGMTYSQAGVIAIKAIQEQQKIIEQQAQEITDLKTQLSAFEERLKALEDRN